jgi:hypothetical protein
VRLILSHSVTQSTRRTEEIERFRADSAEIQFWQGKLRSSAILLRRYIEELRNHVTDSSKVDSFYIYFHWRDMDERVYYNLRLAVVGVYNYENIQEWTAEERYLLENLVEELSKNKLRFKATKFFEFFSFLGIIPYVDQYPKGITLSCPIREFLGNYEINITDWLKRGYTVRYNTPRRVKRKTFHRGYDDKGSESSVSERARRSANTVEFPYLTKDFLKVLQEHSDPIRLLRELGYLRDTS